MLRRSVPHSTKAASSRPLSSCAAGFPALPTMLRREYMPGPSPPGSRCLCARSGDRLGPARSPVLRHIAPLTSERPDQNLSSCNAYIHVAGDRQRVLSHEPPRRPLTAETWCLGIGGQQEFSPACGLLASQNSRALKGVDRLTPAAPDGLPSRPHRAAW
jgi:hypothetical protein